MHVGEAIPVNIKKERRYVCLSSAGHRTISHLTFTKFTTFTGVPLQSKKNEPLKDKHMQ
jgi:hypothetical protein